MSVVADPTPDAGRRREPLGLVATNVVVAFGGVRAVSDVSFTLAPGDALSLVGPNGAGKSTLLNAISGIVPMEGSIRLVDQDEEVELMRKPSHKRARLGVGRTFQHSRLFSEMSVMEQLTAGAYSMQPYGVAGTILRTPRMVRAERDATARATAVLAELGLGGSERMLVSELPGPHRRLIDVGRALMVNPRLLLLDEAAAGLTEGEKVALSEQLLDIARSRGITLVVVEHDLEFIRRTTTRSIVLVNGSVVAAGPTDEVLNRPEVVRAYVGV